MTAVQPLLHSVAAMLATFVAASSTAIGADSIIDSADVSKPAAGEWSRSNGELATNAAAGSRIALPIRPDGEYDFRVSFTRRTGVHSIALIFVAGSGQATFEIDAWGQHLAGIQNVDSRSLRENSTRSGNHTLQNGRRYTAEVRVRKDRVEGYLDGRLISTYRGDGSDLSMLGSWQIPDRTALGIGAWDAEAIFHAIEVTRPGSDTPLPLAVASAASRPVPATTQQPTTPPRSTTSPRRTTATTPRPRTTPGSSPAQNNGGNTGNGRRVLIVIANQDFFYREYADPREELERAGFTVEVAAGSKQTCHPHSNSGEGSDGGAVNPDLALADVDPSRYEAILFSGGWGSSMYQYAFTGSYANQAYNGDRATKEAANRLINEFVAADKRVAALCHGVSILAWSRVNGRSLLAGKRATGPTRQGPAGIYNGRRDQPSSRWNSEANGARMVPPNSVGDPRTAADDIVIDGKILTGQDDISAREMGRQLAAALKRR
ncbi:cyclic nucleotide-binding protein [bacterium]|nr:cyclic nucleotide-binding protein [bacterium]